MGITVDRLGSDSPRNGGRALVGELPYGGATPCGTSGGDLRRVYGENAGSSHCGWGCSVNGGGMLSVGRGVEKSTFGGGSVLRRSSRDGRCAEALASRALMDARVGYAPALSGLVGLETGPAARDTLVTTGGSERVSSGPCSPAGRPGRGGSLNSSAASVAAVDGRDEKPCGGALQAGSS